MGTRYLFLLIISIIICVVSFLINLFEGQPKDKNGNINNSFSFSVRLIAGIFNIVFTVLATLSIRELVELL